MDSLQAVQQVWQIANGDYIDVPAFGAPDDGKALIWDAGSGAFVKATLATSAALAAHIADAANPHGVTAAEVGAYTIANADSAIASAVSSHAGEADPHTPYLLVAGTRASTGTQTFTAGIVSPYAAPASDSTTAWQVRKADKVTAVLTVDTTTPKVAVGTGAKFYADHIRINTAAAGSGSQRLIIQADSGASTPIILRDGNSADRILFQIAASTRAYLEIKDSDGHTGAYLRGGGNDGYIDNRFSFGKTTAATAWVDVAASTTSAASLRMRSGDAPTGGALLDGSIWYPTSGRLSVYRGTTTEIFATGVQATGGAATATGAWTATEQGMLQKVYDAARAFGLLN